ncbi:hypothetical protein [Novosphingobium sp. KACC 22771]|uniref:hypothetical protein n=1 Tax=Novosphingobium sp. KACC 22771 TaxID=3025670 RepID=UPI002366C0C1|nr:hypothetical protein [Novosphingobium sp. KACC 22771]WDF74913.1 hypothetical protein PQ467_17975 [Novosphingobium sp. KACC 22771]
MSASAAALRVAFKRSVVPIGGNSAYRLDQADWEKFRKADLCPIARRAPASALKIMLNISVIAKLSTHDREALCYIYEYRFEALYTDSATIGQLSGFLRTIPQNYRNIELWILDTLLKHNAFAKIRVLCTYPVKFPPSSQNAPNPCDKV